MTIIIDNKRADIPDDLAFEYIDENPLFSDASGYSLNITLPLRGSAANREIFGHIDQMPPGDGMEWPMEIHEGAFNRYGIALLTGVGDGTVTIQFLADRLTREDTPAVFEKSIVSMNYADFYVENINTMPPIKALRSYDEQMSDPGHNEYMSEGVALPWINEVTGAVQNAIVPTSLSAVNPTPKWGSYVLRTGLSWMPYLISVARQVCRNVGYIPKFEAWEASKHRNLIMCNALPQMAGGTHYNFGKALPDWTASEFFDNLSPILGGVFEYDHVSRTITFTPALDLIEDDDLVAPDDVVDNPEITSGFGSEDVEAKYIATADYRYADPGYDEWKYEDCPWLPDAADPQYMLEFDNAQQMHGFATLNDLSRPLSVLGLKAYHVIEDNLWYIYDESGQLRTVNRFGPSRYNRKEEIQYTELKLVPALANAGSKATILNSGNWTDTTANLIVHDVETTGHISADSGQNIKNWSNDGDNSEGDDDGTANMPDVSTSEADFDEYGNLLFSWVENGEPKKPNPIYSLIAVAYWPGWTDWEHRAPETDGDNFSMRLNNGTFGPMAGLPVIDEKVRFAYRFISNTMPDPRATFYIKGKKYICRKITVNMTARGMSRLIKGEFYPVID